MKISPGEIYEDCAYHPVLCTKNDGYSVEGISLIDGSWPRICSISHCGVKKMSLRTAMRVKKNGPSEKKKKHCEALNKNGWEFSKWWK